MKILASAIITMAASFALAHGETQINWPSVNGLPVNNACATDTTFRSVKPVRTCTETKTIRYAVSMRGEQGQVRRELRDGEKLRHGEWLEESTRCVAHGKKDLEVSRMISTRECAYYQRPGEATEPCKKFITKTKKVGLTFNVEKVVHYGEADQITYFNYRVPMCKQ